VDLGGVAKESAEVVKKNYALAIPTVLSVFLVSFVSLAVVESPEDMRGLVLMAFVSMVASYLSHAVTLGMARGAVEAGSASFHGWLRSAGGGLPRYLAASLLLGAIVSGGVMLLVLPGLAAAFLFVFALPYVVVEGAGAVGALGLSYRLVAANLRDSLTVFVFLFTLGMVFGLANVLLSSVKVLGQLLGLVVSGAFGAYASVVVLKAFTELKGRGREGGQAP
jgi:hypothetical protein